jgi:hypothetical protein
MTFKSCQEGQPCFSKSRVIVYLIQCIDKCEVFSTIDTGFVTEFTYAMTFSMLREIVRLTFAVSQDAAAYKYIVIFIISVLTPKLCNSEVI